MLSLCNPTEKTAIEELLTTISTNALSATRVWTCFSNPKAKQTFGDKIISTTPEKITAYQSLKKKVVAELMRKSSKACAYCRRPVGNYGFGWHIEHVYPKSLFAEKAFLLSNLVVGCVDCNRWKGINVDKKVNPNLPIFDPSAPRFNYRKHLKYLSIATDRLSFVYYDIQSPKGKATKRLLNFALIERSTIVDSISPRVQEMHGRITAVLEGAPEQIPSPPLVELLTRLQSEIYKYPTA